MRGNTIVKERKELMVTSSSEEKGENLRDAHFLEPFFNHQNEAHLPKPPCVYLSSNLKMNELKSKLKLSLIHSSNAQHVWNEWLKNLQETHQNSWKKAGIFHALQASTYTILGNTELLFSLAEKWCYDTNTFVFPWGEATITLEDVMILGGFSVSGWILMLNHGLSISTTSNELKKKLYDTFKQIRLRNKDHVTHNAWMHYFKGKGGDLEHVAFLVMWLSRSVFNPNQYYISRYFISLAISLSKGTQFALAPFVLATIYRDLRLLKKKIMDFNSNVYDHKSTPRFVVRDQLVLLWAYERFPSLNVGPHTLAQGEPRIARWHNLSQTSDIGVFKRMIESSQIEFNWKPYALEVENWEIPKFYCDEVKWIVLNPDMDEQLLAYARCLLPCLLDGVNCVELYLPHRVGMQFGFDQDIPNFDFISKFNVEVNWSCYCEKLDDFKLYLPSRLSKGSITVKYLEWMKTWPLYQVMSERNSNCRREKKRVETGENEIASEEKKYEREYRKKGKQKERVKGGCKKRKRMEVLNTSLESKSDNSGKDFLSCSSPLNTESTGSSNKSWNEESIDCVNNRFPSQISSGDSDDVQIISVRRRSRRLMNASLAKRTQERLIREKEMEKENGVNDEKDLDDTFSMDSSESHIRKCNQNSSSEGIQSEGTVNGADESENVGTINSVKFSRHTYDGIEYIIVEAEDSEEIETSVKRGECSKYYTGVSDFGSRLFNNGSYKNSESREKHKKGMQYAPRKSEAREDGDDNATSKDREVKSLFTASKKNNSQKSKKSRKMKSRQKINKLQKASGDEFVNVAYGKEHPAEFRNTKKGTFPDENPAEEIRYMYMNNEESLEIQNKHEKKAISRSMFPKIRRYDKVRRGGSICLNETISGDEFDEEGFSIVLDTSQCHPQKCPEDDIVGPHMANEDEASPSKTCLGYAKPAPEQQPEGNAPCICEGQYNETNQRMVVTPVIGMEDIEQSREGKKKDETVMKGCKRSKSSDISGNTTRAEYRSFGEGVKGQMTKEVNTKKQTTSTGTLILDANDFEEVISQDPEPQSSVKLVPLVCANREDDGHKDLEEGEEKELKLIGSNMKLNVDNECIDDQQGTEDGDGVHDPFESMIYELEARISGLKRVIFCDKSS